MLVSVIAALAAGCTFAVGSVLQQSAARQAPTEQSLSWRLLVGLAHRRIWLLGIGSDAASFTLQALALAFGPLALVQPMLVTGVLFAVPLAVRKQKRRLGAREWVGTVAVAGGLALFLVAASPAAGHARASTSRWLLVLAAVAAVMVVGVVLGKSARGTARPSLYAVAAGSAFGLLAALTKTSTSLLSDGPVAFFTAWQPYAMAVVAVLGAIVQQSAFQSGPLPASLPVMDAMEPTVATLIGVFAFGEALRTSPVWVGLEALGVAALLAGVVALDRSPVILDLQRNEQRAPAKEPPGSAPDDGSETGYDASRVRSSSAKSG